LSVTYGSNTNAGTASASASFAGDANHTGSSDSTTFTIDKAPSTTTVTCPATVVYTGSPITPCSAAVTGAGGLSQTLSVTYGSNTGVGTASAAASYAGDANHLSSSNSTTFGITKATLLVSANSLSKTIGAANPPLTYTITGFLGTDTAASSVTGSPSLSTTATTGSPVGSYPISIAAGTLASVNYQFTLVGATLTVYYRFDGFLQPINDTAHSQTCGATCPISIFKAGSTIPVKFELKRSDGSIVPANAPPTFTGPVKGGKTTDPVDESAYTELPTPGSSFSLNGGQYQYNWSTKGLQAGYYYRIGAVLDDGTVQYVYIGLR
ncbi:MAG TPA: PxKF domain-containing protein, partial [Candidatus Limnocylindrales bacterium]